MSTTNLIQHLIKEAEKNIINKAYELASEVVLPLMRFDKKTGKHTKNSAYELLESCVPREGECQKN